MPPVVKIFGFSGGASPTQGVVAIGKSAELPDHLSMRARMPQRILGVGHTVNDQPNAVILIGQTF